VGEEDTTGAARGEPTTPNALDGDGLSDCERRELLSGSKRLMASSVDSPPSDGRFGSNVLHVRWTESRRRNESNTQTENTKRKKATMTTENTTSKKTSNQKTQASKQKSKQTNKETRTINLEKHNLSTTSIPRSNVTHE
jgi:hypothetical protein